MARTNKKPTDVSSEAVASNATAFSLSDAKDRAEYNKAVSLAKLDTIKLKSSKFDVKVDYYKCLNDDRELPDASRKLLSHGFRVNNSQVLFDDEEGMAFAIYNFDVEVRHKKKKVLNIGAEYVIVYSRLLSCKEAAVEAFIKKVAPFAIFPYFRSLVSILSAEAGADLPILPVLRSDA